MPMYVGITDSNWFQFLKERKADEVNFWKPGSQPFKALQENDLFLFKLHSPQNYIVGGGFFVKYSKLPIFLAWEAFKEKNGASCQQELNSAIEKYQVRNNIQTSNPEIGCIILTDVFYFEEADWIPHPEKYCGPGKRYYLENPDGKWLFQEVQDRLQSIRTPIAQEKRYAESVTKHRLGQGAFRILVTDAYDRRCAITGEKTLPVLEAAHIRAYASDGPHEVNNGILLKSDFHTLYDKGYITITDDYHIEVSRRLHQDFGNGKDYYKHHGQGLLVLPKQIDQLPSKEHLRWHNEHVYIG